MSTVVTPITPAYITIKDYESVTATTTTPTKAAGIIQCVIDGATPYADVLDCAKSIEGGDTLPGDMPVGATMNVVVLPIQVLIGTVLVWVIFIHWWIFLP